MVSIKCNADDICNGILVDNLYILEPISQVQVNSIESNHKRKELSLVNQTQLWHLRLVTLTLIGFATGHEWTPQSTRRECTSNL